VSRRSRATLPGAAELFRTTARGSPGLGTTVAPAPEQPSDRQAGTGRQRHTAKITVYVSDEELLALEQSRLSLRSEHGLAVDRGRIVREAVAVLLADFDEHGERSVLVRRLSR
jgi:hypothetical protein